MAIADVTVECPDECTGARTEGHDVSCGHGGGETQFLTIAAALHLRRG